MNNKQSIKEEIIKLTDLINYHNKKYYIDVEPEISDYEYDHLLKQLIDLEMAYPDLIDPNSPSQRVGGDTIDSFRTVEHKIPMKSLGNTYSDEELYNFDQRVKKLIPNEQIEYVVELKIDGVSISLIYEQGKLIQAITRGDGQKGDDVTHNVRTIKSLPLTLKEPISIEVRGEIFFPTSKFLIFNQEREKKEEKVFANPRNATAGSLKLLNPKIVAKRPLDAFFYNIPNGSNSDFPLTHFERLNLLKDLDFKVNPHITLFSSIEEVIQYISTWSEKRHTLDYETDGMVIKVNSIVQQEKLGYTSKEPRWAIAYKFPAKQMTTKIKNIILSVGRLGNITPIADLEPIFLSGTTVTRASLHNFDEIQRKDVRVGDTVFVEKSGEIIPQVVSVVTSKRENNSQPYPIPTQCPECLSDLVHDESEVALKCINVSCPAQIKRRIQHFTSKAGLDIDGLGENIVNLLIDKGFIKDYGDIFYLKKEDLVPLEGFGEKSADKLVQAVEKSKSSPLSRLLSALGIKHIGAKAARILSEHYHSIHALQQATYDELISIHEVGPIMAESIIEFFKEPQNQLVLSKMEKSGVQFYDNFIKKETNIKDNFFTNKKFVITGTLNQFSRQEATDKITELGGSCSSSISSKTDYLVAGEKAGSKLQKAKDLNITVLTEEELISKLKDSSS